MTFKRYIRPEFWRDRTKRLVVCLALSALTLRADLPQAPATLGNLTASVRERISFNADWRFHTGDPAGNTVCLSYDVRPAVANAKDDKAADAEPETAAKIAPAGAAVLKPWILPSGDAFLGNPARRHIRPDGDPGGTVDFVKATFDDASWRVVQLPHDWAIEGPFFQTGDFGGMGRLPSWGVGWYRKKFDVPAGDAGRRLLVEFEGAMSYATVWLNGHLVGGWPYGYSSWSLDLTPYVRFGYENQLAVRLDNPPSSSRWYPGGGLYRNVWLVKTSGLHVGQWGTAITTPEVSAHSARVDLSVEIENDASDEARVETFTDLFELDAKGAKTGSAVARFAPVASTVACGSSVTLRSSVALAHPRLWQPLPAANPAQYVAVTTLLHGGAVVDVYETRFGIRSLRLDPNVGLLVNGGHVPIRGVNLHHDLGALGAAFNRRAAERQLEALREMGCNALRLSHNPPAPELLDLADTMGFLVLDEAFDVWERSKTPFDFHLIFPDWHEQDLRALVRRDRNHPSVFLWSIGNEVGEQYTDAAGAAIAKELCDIVHEEDPTRPTTSAMNFAKPDMPLPAVLDVIGLNYQGEGIRQDPEFEGTERIRTAPQYAAYHAKFPRKAVLSTETASAFSSRGVYLFPVSKAQSAPVRDGRGGDSKAHHVSAYELHAVDFGSSVEKVFAALQRNPFVAGEFVWTGWDHLGEPTPYYEARSSYAGIIDLAGFKKDRFYLYQSHWRPDVPMAHLLPHWTWPERLGQVTPVHVFTSGDEGELFLNGRSLGRRVKGPQEYRLRWDDVVYEPGTLEVVIYRKGIKWATDRVSTAGAPAMLEAAPDRKAIRADGRDLCFITVQVVDSAHTLVPRADQGIRFSIEGPGDIVATDNGDPTNFTPFQSHERAAFSGRCLVIVRGRSSQPGTLRISVSSAGLQNAVATISTQME